MHIMPGLHATKKSFPSTRDTGGCTIQHLDKKCTKLLVNSMTPDPSFGIKLDRVLYIDILYY